MAEGRVGVAHPPSGQHLDRSAGWRSTLRLTLLGVEIRHPWELRAGGGRTKALLANTARRHPDDRALAELAGELSINGLEFARRWARRRAAASVRAGASGPRAAEAGDARGGGGTRGSGAARVDAVGAGAAARAAE